MDLNLEVYLGKITPREAKIQILKRDMKDLKKEPFYLMLLLSGIIAIGVQVKLPLYLMMSAAAYLVLRDIYSTWMKLAEKETELIYIESGLLLIRDRR